MAVDFVQTWSWGPLTNSGSLQTNYFRIPLSGTPHIIGSAYLAEVSVGEQAAPLESPSQLSSGSSSWTATASSRRPR